MFLGILAALGLAYLLAALAIAYSQARFLFPAGSVEQAGPVPAGSAPLRLETPDGERLEGIHISPGVKPGRDRALILAFGGNAWNAQTAASYLHDLYPASDILAFHYRGYAPSSGSPSAAALTADSLLIHDHVARLQPGRRIVAVGFSVGSGIAAYLASRRPIAGLILITPFDSLERVAQDHLRWLPIAWLFRHPMPASDWLRTSKLPIAIVAAGKDGIVGAARTDALRRAIPNLVDNVTIANAGHNEIYGRPEFRQAMQRALARIESE